LNREQEKTKTTFCHSITGIGCFNWEWV